MIVIERALSRTTKMIIDLTMMSGQGGVILKKVTTIVSISAK